MDWRRLVGLTRNISDSTGLGPDFPDSAGDRERGKFRLSEYPRLTTVAVSGDGGEPIAKTTEQLLEELIYEMKLLRQALVLSGIAADIDTSL